MKSPLVVLLVEDHLATIEALTLYLEKLPGHEVLTVDSFDAALEIIRAERRIDLLLCDVHLPGLLDGADVAKATLRDHPDVAIVMMSASIDFHMGCSPDRFAFVKKPFGLEQLKHQIGKAFAATA